MSPVRSRTLFVAFNVLLALVSCSDGVRSLNDSTPFKEYNDPITNGKVHSTVHEPLQDQYITNSIVDGWKYTVNVGQGIPAKQATSAQDGVPSTRSPGDAERVRSVDPSAPTHARSAQDGVPSTRSPGDAERVRSTSETTPLKERSDRNVRYASGEDRSSGRYTREVRIKQGAIRGLVLEPSIIENLQNVDMYRGLPYAAPPVGSLRFMPPGSPPPWTGVRTADRFGPVCPQTLPDLGSEPGKTMSEGRYNSLKRLLPYLTNQSEDCLYLNIYTPSQGGGRTHSKYPVIVFIHGESYEWNSGNPYDGSVLASYGHVVVITINFRLGILGFLKPGIGEHTVSNFGLWDQIAALQWVKENVGAFGGDPHSVTIMGHGTGAACANLLLVSPVSNGLFHRAILMSGTALADWALTTNPIQSTIQVAEALNCPSNGELAACLRRKRLSEIMRVRVQTPAFKTPFGPVIDGSVVPNEPAQVMGVYKDLFSRYELLYGVTEVESYHLLDAVSLHLGMLERERDQLLRQYVQARFEFLPDLALAKTLYEYNTHWRTVNTNRPIAEQHRDSLLEILSDARVASPLVQTADYHSNANPKSYFYVFSHRTKHGDFAEANVFGSIHGEELAYVFGVPMDNGRFPQAFTNQEKLFSEAIMTYWTNFAKTGNPNAPRRSAFLSQGPRDWRQYDIDWPEYDVNNQTFLNLGIPPQYGYQYRKQLMNFWNDVLPKQLKNPSTSNTRIVLPPPLLDTESPRMEVSPPWGAKPPQAPQDRYENFNKPYMRPPRPTQKPLYGKVIHEEGGRSKGLMDGPSGKEEDVPTEKPPTTAGNSNMALSLVVIIGICFLVVNVCAFAALFYQRGRLKIEERIMKRRLDEGGRVEEGDMNTYAKRVKIDLKGEKPGKEGDGVYEAVSKQTASENMRRWRGQGSSSTVDAHTKVRDWIQHEIVNRCSPRFIRRPRLINQKPLAASTETSFSQSTMMVPGSSTQREASCKTPTTTNTLLRKVKKVSVAVDATPAARSASVQKQIPIELSKSLDALTNLTAAQRPILKRSNTTMDDNVIKKDSSSSPVLLRRSTTSINLLPFVQKNEESIDEEVLTIHHGHSHSEPIPFTLPFMADIADDVGPGNSQSMKAQIVNIAVEKDSNTYNKNPPIPMSTFPKQGPKPTGSKKDASVTTASQDINVTSRDSYDDQKEISTEDPLANMQRRNFPKVLPDLPIEDFVDDVFTPKQAAMKRRSLPPPSNMLINLLTPVPEAPTSQPTTPTGGPFKKPPPPPPRISSTLGRKPTNTSPIISEVTKRPPFVILPTSSANPTPTIQRMEPKVIIKPTNNKNPQNQNKSVTHPTVGARVTANNDLRQTKTEPTNRGPLQSIFSIKAPENRTVPAATSNAPQSRTGAIPKATTQQTKTPDMTSRKLTKKNCETSTDDDSSSNTGTIKRAHKTDAKKK